ncbi:MAG TPA: arsenic resistance N-acetyltransferase ArsN2 [Gammaproteobacteria bacterium]
MKPVIRTAGADDVAAICLALRAAGLPVEGVDTHAGTFFVCENEGVLLGAAGLEVHGGDGLLRSLVVVPGTRRRGIGQGLCQRVMDEAANRGCGAVYLLTLDAAAYFERLGFEMVARDDAPSGIRESREFSALCPASAVLMRRRIGPRPRTAARIRNAYSRAVPPAAARAPPVSGALLRADRAEFPRANAPPS